MRTALRLISLAIAAGTTVFWFFGGPSFDRTRTHVESWQIDPERQVEFPTLAERFIPGIDFLLAGLAVAAIIWMLSTLRPFRTSS